MVVLFRFFFKLFFRLSEVFPTAWTASAYKGADGPTAAVPNIRKRLTNNLNWLDLMASEEFKFKGQGFQGIVITGWSRYDHFAVLAELLPAAMPSLVSSILKLVIKSITLLKLIDFKKILGD